MSISAKDLSDRVGAARPKTRLRVVTPGERVYMEAAADGLRHDLAADEPSAAEDE